jgi:hypothetical protein
MLRQLLSWKSLVKWICIWKMTLYNIDRPLVELMLQSMDFLRSQGQLLSLSWRGLLLDAVYLRKPGKVAFRILCLKISYLQLLFMTTMLSQQLLKTGHLLKILSKNVHYQVFYFLLVLFVMDVFSMLQNTKAFAFCFIFIGFCNLIWLRG